MDIKLNKLYKKIPVIHLIYIIPITTTNAIKIFKTGDLLCFQFLNLKKLNSNFSCIKFSTATFIE